MANSWIDSYFCTAQISTSVDRSYSRNHSKSKQHRVYVFCTKIVFLALLLRLVLVKHRHHHSKIEKVSGFYLVGACDDGKTCCWGLYCRDNKKPIATNSCGFCYLADKRVDYFPAGWHRMISIWIGLWGMTYYRGKNWYPHFIRLLVIICQTLYTCLPT